MSRTPTRGATGLLVVGLLAALTPQATARQPEPPVPVELCVVTDERLSELSGLASDGELLYAIGDGGDQLQVTVLHRDCTVQRVITAAINPYDPEDLAIDAGGRLWVADTGDNSRRRDTVALHVIGADGAPKLYRLTYPDGPRDAEALLLDRDGQPYLVSKAALGSAGVYRPAAPLAAPGPTELERLASVRLGPTDTPGGPVAGAGSMTVTGGAVSADGTVIALRTYTDAYLYPAPDGDVVAALDREPVRIPLPDQPQGEAIAFDPDGSLLSASEWSDAGPQPVTVVSGATGLVDAAGQQSTTTGPAPTAESTGPTGATSADGEPDDRGGLSDRQAVLVAVAAGVAVIGLIAALSRGARRRPAADQRQDQEYGPEY